MTVTLNRAQLIQKLDVAVAHLNKVESEPNKARKRVSEFLRETGRFLKNGQTLDYVLDRESLKNKPEVAKSYQKVVQLFLEKDGKHGRHIKRDALAKTLMTYLEIVNSPRSNKLENRKGSGYVYKTPTRRDRVSTKNLMDSFQANESKVTKT